MHVRFVGEADDGLSLSSHHARLLERAGCRTSFALNADDDATAIAGAVGSDPAFAIHAVFNERPDPALIRQLLAQREMGIAVLRFWTGADLLWAQFDDAARAAGRELAAAGVWQFCRSDASAAKLATLGIDARRFPLFSARVWDGTPPQPLPQQFTALCYLPAARREFHGAELIGALTRWLPRVRFLILGGERADYPGQSNVEPLGRVDDVIRTIQRSTVLLQARLDGAPSRLMIESLSLGRHVIANCPWSNCGMARTPDEFLAAIRALQRDLTFNLIGREEVCRGHDRSVAANVLKSIFEAAAVPSDLISRLGALWSPPPAPPVEGVAPDAGPAAFCCERGEAPAIGEAEQRSRDEAAFAALTAPPRDVSIDSSTGSASGCNTAAGQAGKLTTAARATA